MKENRYSRQIQFSPIGPKGQASLNRASVAIVGCGALGTHIAQFLVRSGVGSVHIIDRDFIELNNLQRQTLFTEHDISQALPKAEAAARTLRTMNSSVQITATVTDLNHTNAERLLNNADIIMDGTDNFETRYLLNEIAVHQSTPWIYGACVGSYGIVMAIRPEITPCLQCVTGTMPAPGTLPTCETAGVLNTIPAIVASYQCNEALKIIMNDTDALMDRIISIDIWKNTFHQFKAKRDPACPVCVMNIFGFLHGDRSTAITTLCGRNGIQIIPPESSEQKIDFQQLSLALASYGTVSTNEYLLRFTVDEVECTLFPEGRAILKGISDPIQAKSFYTKYIGM